MRLATLQIKNPCGERWDQMTGDERSRHCAQCACSVVSLSELEEKEAEAALSAGPVCVRFVRDNEGKIVTRTTYYNQLVNVLLRFSAKTK